MLEAGIILLTLYVWSVRLLIFNIRHVSWASNHFSQSCGCNFACISRTDSVRFRICCNSIFNTDSSIQINFFIFFFFQRTYKNRSIIRMLRHISSSDMMLHASSPPRRSFRTRRQRYPARSSTLQGQAAEAVSGTIVLGLACGIVPENLASFAARPFEPACTGTPAPKCRTNETQKLCYRQELKYTICNRFFR